MGEMAMEFIIYIPRCDMGCVRCFAVHMPMYMWKIYNKLKWMGLHGSAPFELTLYNANMHALRNYVPISTIFTAAWPMPEQVSQNPASAEWHFALANIHCPHNNCYNLPHSELQLTCTKMVSNKVSPRAKYHLVLPLHPFPHPRLFNISTIYYLYMDKTGVCWPNTNNTLLCVCIWINGING